MPIAGACARGGDAMITVAVVDHSGLGAPATLSVAGHPAVRAIVVSRDLGDLGARSATLRGVPCLLLEFAEEAGAAAAFARLTAVTAKFAYRESPTHLACSGDVSYTLRVVRDFDEPTIAAIAAHHEEATARYVAALRATSGGAQRRRR